MLAREQTLTHTHTHTSGGEVAALSRVRLALAAPVRAPDISRSIEITTIAGKSNVEVAQSSPLGSHLPPQMDARVLGPS